jgi:hypothetical protein
MNIIELAKEHNIHVYNNPEDGIKQLEAFATAIIEDYKTGLVPVAVVDEVAEDLHHGNYIFNGKFIGDKLPVNTKLYELGETK